MNARRIEGAVALVTGANRGTDANQIRAVGEAASDVQIVFNNAGVALATRRGELRGVSERSSPEPRRVR